MNIRKKNDKGSLEGGNVKLVKKRAPRSNRKNGTVKKEFILDTNVPMLDGGCIEKFDENDVTIPIHVIAELDAHKDGNESISFNAREFIRKIEKLQPNNSLNSPVSIGPGLGKMLVSLDRPFHDDIKDNFINPNMDDKIINIAYWRKKENPKSEIVLISRDANVRLKAKSIGLAAQDLFYDQIKDIDFLSEKIKTHNVNDNFFNNLFIKGEFDYEIKDASENQNFILQFGEKTCLVRYANKKVYVINKKSTTAFNLESKNSEQSFAMNALLDPNITLVALEGKAGTGKTLITLACALEQLDKGIYDRILCLMSTTPVNGNEVGFLPGDIKDKISPYAKRIVDNVEFLKTLNKNKNNRSRIESFVKNDVFQIDSIAMARGRSIPKSFIIIDETQNLSPLEVKTLITRAGQGSKVVCTGDTAQIDVKFLNERSNGFSHMIQNFKEINHSCFSYVHLYRGERSELAELAGSIL